MKTLKYIDCFVGQRAKIIFKLLGEHDAIRYATMTIVCYPTWSQIVFAMSVDPTQI